MEWTFESVRTRLRTAYVSGIAWRYCLGGLLPDWRSFRDPLQAVHTPAQLAPAWYHVAVRTGATLDERIWHEDPPASSYPACLAVKAAARQGAAAEDHYLRAARVAFMTRRLNIARSGTLLQIAAELADEIGFNADQFRHDLASAQVAESFAADLRQCRVHQVGRFPTFIVSGPHCSRLVVGYRPFDMFVRVLEAVGAQTVAL